MQEAVRRIGSDEGLDATRKAYLLQNIMASRYIVAQQKRMRHAPLHDANSSAGAQQQQQQQHLHPAPGSTAESAGGGGVSGKQQQEQQQRHQVFFGSAQIAHGCMHYQRGWAHPQLAHGSFTLLGGQDGVCSCFLHTCSCCLQ